MDQHRAFLDAIIEDPDDDTVRLVYADWLEEHGSLADQARAQLIRLQVESERVEDTARYRAIIDQCNTLIDRYRQEWTLGFRADSDSFRRGFITRTFLNPEDLSDPAFDVMMAHEPISEFYIWFPEKFPSLTQWKHLPRVRRLNILDHRSGDASKAILRSPLLSGLRQYDGGIQLNEEDVAFIASDIRFTGLRSLDISGNALCDRAVELVARSQTLSQLTSFDYGSNNTTVAALEALAASPLAERLISIGLDHHRGYPNYIPGIGGRVIDLLAQFRCLERIDITGHDVGDEGVENLARSPRLAGLKRLLLGQNTLGPRGVNALLSSPDLTWTEELDLSWNVDSWHHLTRNAGRDMDEWDIGLNASAMEWILAIVRAKPRRLRKLNLASNKLNAKAVDALATAPIIEGLRELSLESNPISDEGAVALSRSAHMQQMRRLDLSYCDIGDEGAFALAHSPAMRGLEDYGELKLRGNVYGEEAALRLRERFGYDPG